ncbi:MAG: 6,7-dimethyl-8-ribityllumazine synthase [Planctomycetia bacterium]|nr:6,7-dimethyl-8-ribityllumazine synthase [Planctomycetia bacterium]
MFCDGTDMRIPENAGRFAVIVARFNPTITGRLLTGALETLKEHGVAEDQIDVIRVPGAFEIPLTANRLAKSVDVVPVPEPDIPEEIRCLVGEQAARLGRTRRCKRPRYAAILCLGAVIRGETSHDRHINRAVSMALMEIGQRTGVPCLFGVLTCDTLEQAIARSGGETAASGKETEATRIGHKGIETAEAAIEMVSLLAKLPSVREFHGHSRADRSEYSGG